jgi:hypothetical protein
MSDQFVRISLRSKAPPGTFVYVFILVGRAPSGVVSNRVGRVSPIIDTAAARKIDVRFFFVLKYG